MTEINFQPVFDYIDKSIEPLKVDIVALKKYIFNIYSILDENLKEMKTYREEQVVSGHRTDRLEAWAQPVGKKIDIPFET